MFSWQSKLRRWAGITMGLTLVMTSCQAESLAPEVKPITSTEGVKSTPTAEVLEPSGTFEAVACWFEVPETAQVDCGFVIVEEDHFEPTGKTIRLAVAIMRDKGMNHQPDPVIMLAGGPGERIAADAIVLGQAIAPLHPNRDLIIFDQRGVGLSEPALECPEFLEAMMDNLDESDSGQVAKSQFDSLMQCRDRYLAEGINLPVYNTRQSAADVEALRVALGYETVNLFGGSYGSLLAQAVMRDFPEHVRSVSMSSVLPIEKSVLLDTSTTASQAILDLLQACEGESTCASVYPDLKQKLFSVVERLNLNPLTMTLTHPISGEQYEALLTGDGVVGNLFTFLYISRIIPVLPQAIHDVYQGDYNLMQQLSSSRLALLDGLSRGTMLSVLCRDDLIGRTPQDQLEIRQALPDPLVSDIEADDLRNYAAFGLCENWPVPQDEAWVKLPLQSEIPTLLLAGEFDPITPPDYARLVASELEHGYLFEFPATGHDVLSSPCAQTIASSFVENPQLSPQSACINDMKTISFNVPTEIELSLQPFVDETRGFQGLVPAGWQELSPANLARKQTALDPAYFVLESKAGSRSGLFSDLTSQLGLDATQAPDDEQALGNFSWTLYKYDRGEVVIDIAITESDGKAYFVLLISPLDEYDLLNSDLFLPAVKAMKPIS